MRWPAQKDKPKLKAYSTADCLLFFFFFLRGQFSFGEITFFLIVAISARLLGVVSAIGVPSLLASQVSVCLDLLMQHSCAKNFKALVWSTGSKGYVSLKGRQSFMFYSLSSISFYIKE